MRFTADFTVIAEWVDKRLTWNDLNQDHYLNMPSEQEKQGFWIPKFVFGNSEKILQIPNDSKAKVLVKRTQNPTMSDPNIVRETAFFSGAHNPIQLSRDFIEKFKCDFNLQYFPFDTQTCMILINARLTFLSAKNRTKLRSN